MPLFLTGALCMIIAEGPLSLTHLLVLLLPLLLLLRRLPLLLLLLHPQAEASGVYQPSTHKFTPAAAAASARPSLKHHRAANSADHLL
jgi:hypothetical protein